MMKRQMNKNEVQKDYLDWMITFVCNDHFSEEISFRKMLEYLHNTEFTWSMKDDKNRAGDGVNLRRRFSKDVGYEYNYFLPYLDEPCSILEMILALALRCEETIMLDPHKGDRTTQWFWGMINNLGLGGFTDARYDEKKVKEIVDIFLNREYEPSGRGGLFTVRNCEYDMRDVEIWRQLCYYLNTIA